MSMKDHPVELLLNLYRQMVTVREFELRAINERRAGLIPGFIHSCVGQEATAVGACAALHPDDAITSTHRGHGHLVAKGGEPRYMMAELAARTTGYCGGKGGSLHMTTPSDVTLIVCPSSAGKDASTPGSSPPR